MKSFDYEACTYDGAVYCNSCLPEGLNTESEGVSPIFADSEWDGYPCCDHCGCVHDYVSLTREGVRYELRQNNQEFFYLSATDFLNADTGSWMEYAVRENAGIDEHEEPTKGEREAAAIDLAGWYYWTCLPGGENSASQFRPNNGRNSQCRPRRTGQDRERGAGMSELENLIKWAKTACEEERARIGFDCEEETLCPSWLPELERALLDYEAAQ